MLRLSTSGNYLCDTVQAKPWESFNQMSVETEPGFNIGVVVEELLKLLVKKGVLEQKDVERLLESAKLHLPEVPEEPGD